MTGAFVLTKYMFVHIDMCVYYDVIFVILKSIHYKITTVQNCKLSIQHGKAHDPHLGPQLHVLPRAQKAANPPLIFIA